MKCTNDRDYFVNDHGYVFFTVEKAIKQNWSAYNYKIENLNRYRLRKACEIR
ncbi:hypothetical protein BDB01DRAFT_782639 [Pilobolus umbonatus]|nr:hypothetical protein BDB01DRAFT_782639 [Pilobolus umbonatus]